MTTIYKGTQFEISRPKSPNEPGVVISKPGTDQKFWDRLKAYGDNETDASFIECLKAMDKDRVPFDTLKSLMGALSPGAPSESGDISPDKRMKKRITEAIKDQKDMQNFFKYLRNILSGKYGDAIKTAFVKVLKDLCRVLNNNIEHYVIKLPQQLENIKSKLELIKLFKDNNVFTSMTRGQLDKPKEAVLEHIRSKLSPVIQAMEPIRKKLAQLESSLNAA